MASPDDVSEQDAALLGSEVSCDDGEKLHRDVPPSRWGVSSADLRHFSKLVQRAVGRGEIVPIEKNMFSVEDFEYGPDVTTVNEQLIIPTTRIAGGMSWALMLRRAGLSCDVFISHCWQEGIYELITKVVHSWPRGARGAYCCMLSNPQCLDITKLICDPHSSPFAIALRSATWTLVVPNRLCSPYGRVWCAYEAFLAYRWDKQVYTASRPVPQLWKHVLAVMATSALCMVATLLVFQSHPLLAKTVLLWPFTFCPLMAACLAITLSSSSVPITLYYVFAGVTGASAGLHLHWTVEHDAVRHGILWLIPSPLWVFYHAYFSCMFAACSADWLRDAELQLQTLQLCTHFTGSISDAKATNPKDKERIMSEIVSSGSQDDVDRTIDVLIKTGISTSNLREAAACGADVQGGGHWSLALILAVVLIFWIHPLTHIVLDSSCNGLFRFAPWLKIAESSVWIGIFHNKRRDEKGFVAAVGGKLAAAPYLMIWSLWALRTMVLGLPFDRMHCVPDTIGSCVMGPCMLVFSFLGVAHTAGLPVLGPSIVSNVLAGGFQRMLKVAGAEESGAASDTDEMTPLFSATATSSPSSPSGP